MKREVISLYVLMIKIIEHYFYNLDVTDAIEIYSLSTNHREQNVSCNQQ